MIWQPTRGQKVIVRYNKRVAKFAPHHDKAAVVECVARGPGPRNVGVRFADGERVVVPRGNLVL